MTTLSDFSQAIVETGRRMAEAGLIVAFDGNISVRLPSGNMLVTPSGVAKGRLSPSGLIEIDADGAVVSGSSKPSLEIKMHLAVYARRPDVGAVVHAHPTAAIALSLAGISLETPLLSEVVLSLGGIPTAPYATPTTDEVPTSLLPFVDRHNAIILARHGAVTMGKNLDEAFARMETVEHAAQVVAMAHSLGKVKPLSAKETERLLEIRKQLGLC